MARYSWVQIDGKLIPRDEVTAERSGAPFVRGDLPAYQSMATGEMIEGRAAHREHLKRHSLIEVGNENLTNRPIAPPPGLKERLYAVADSKLRRK